MKLLLMTEAANDLTDVLESCGIDIDRMTVKDAIGADISCYDAFCLLGYEKKPDARLHQKLEQAAAAGKRIFVEATGSFYGIYSDAPKDTTRSRLIYVSPENGDGIPGLCTGDLLDDQANRMMRPWNTVAGYQPLLVYKEHIIAHTHLNASREEILTDSSAGLWMIGENIMMTSFHLHNFSKARFSPRAAWEKLILYIARWITGNKPQYLPKPVVTYGVQEDLTDDAIFERCKKNAIDRGISWLKGFLVDDGYGGLKEGMRHNIDPEGKQDHLNIVRNDCSGEAAGAFKMYAHLYGENRGIAEHIDSYTYGPMLIKGGLFDGFMRWSDEAWQVCYQDDVARCVLPGLYDALFLGHNEVYPEICRALDFLLRTTAKDGCRTWRTDMYHMDAHSFEELTSAEHGTHAAHYNAYYHAALLLAYRYGKDERYLTVAKNGLEKLMSLYPNTQREQSETQEMCRLIFPLAALYEQTGEMKHKEMLYRVTNDLMAHKHPSGGFYEWDTDYKAACSRESTGECSILTENGDPVADLLYSVNWLPIGFAYAYHVTGDKLFYDLWRDVVSFCIKTQMFSENPESDGAWCRAFDMELWEVCGCPHDIGWAPNVCETGWTTAEILMGMMLMDILQEN